MSPYLYVNTELMNSFSVDQLEEHFNSKYENYLTILFQYIDIHEIARDKLEVLFKHLSKIEDIGELHIYRSNIDKLELDLVKKLIKSVKGRIRGLLIIEEDIIDTISLNRKLIYLDLINPNLHRYFLVNSKIGIDINFERDLITALTKAPIDEIYLYNNNFGSHKELNSVYIDLFSSKKKYINLKENKFGSSLSEEDFIEMMKTIKQNDYLEKINFGDNSMQLVLNENSSYELISFITSTSKWLDKIILSDNFEKSIIEKIAISMNK